MRKFREMIFFHILESQSQVKPDHQILVNAYDEFAESLYVESESTHNLTLFYNQLCFAQVELQNLQASNLPNMETECQTVQCHIDKALLLLNAQIKLVKWKMKTSVNMQPKLERRRLDKVKWTGTIVELVEFGYASLASRSFNSGEIEIKELIAYLSNIFDFEVKDCYRVFVDIRHRNGDRTFYLDKLKDKLIQKMEYSDNRDRKK